MPRSTPRPDRSSMRRWRTPALTRLVPGIEPGLAAWLAGLVLALAWHEAGRLSPALVQLAAFCAAFWVALADFERRGGGRRHRLRAMAGLLGGALGCHLGWLALHADVAGLRHLLAPTGFSALFLPAGVLAGLAVAPAAVRGRMAGPLVSSLFFGLAVARLGCFAAGCCPGRSFSGQALPFPLLDAALLAMGGAILDRVPRAWVGPAALALFGASRLVLHPLRAPGGPDAVVHAVASVWIACAAAWALADFRSCISTPASRPCWPPRTPR